MVRHVAIAVLVTLAGGCGDSTPAGAGDAAAFDANTAGVDATEPDAPPSCDTPLECATWLRTYQMYIVGMLSGELEIEPGLSLTARASSAERDAARSFIVGELEALGLDVSLHDYGTGANVVVELAATEPDPRVLIMGAHFDGVSAGPAAADNATGVSIVLSAARLFSELATRNHTIMFVLFDEEEIGLVGSKAFSAKLVTDRVDVQAVHSFDMVSWDSDMDGAVELWSPTSELQALYEQVGAELAIPVRSHPFEFSDHQSFLDDGFAAVGVAEEVVSGDFTPHYHKATDSYDKINFAYLESITRMVLTVVPRTPTGR